MSDQIFKNSYLTYLSTAIKAKPLTSDHYELVTPFVDSHGETIAFSIYREANRFWLSDDGYTLWDRQFDDGDSRPLSKQKEKRLQTVLVDYQLVLSDDANQEICSEKVTSDHLGETIHQMIQALMVLDTLLNP